MSHWKTEYLSRIKEGRSWKMVAMRSRAIRPSNIREIEDRMNDLMNVRKERRKRIGNEEKINNGDAIT